MHAPHHPERAGPIGRSARMVLGLVFLWVFVRLLRGYSVVTQPGNLVLYTWAALGVLSHAPGSLIPPLRKRNRRIPVLLAAIFGTWVLDVFLFGSGWGPPLRILLYALSLMASGVLGVEFVLAGWMGQAGCESTVLPNLFRRDRPANIEPCPLWDPIDRWESQRNKEKGRSRGPQAES